MSHAPDVSHWQGVVDWKQVTASGVSVAIAKATQGVSNVDPQFVANRAAMRANKITHRGFYHFADVTSSAVKQAAHFTSTVGTIQPGEFLVLDIEIGSAGSTVANRKWVTDFLNTVTVNGKITANAVWIYSGSGWWNPTIGGWTPPGHPLWLAEYTTATSPRLPSGWSMLSLVAWQWTSTASIPGVKGHCDDSRILQDVAKWSKPLVPAPIIKPVTPVTPVKPIITPVSPVTPPAPKPPLIIVHKPSIPPWPGPFGGPLSRAHGDHVKAVQKGLGLATTGVWDAHTQARMVAYQRVRPLLWRPDGIVGARTYKSCARPV